MKPEIIDSTEGYRLKIIPNYRKTLITFFSIFLGVNTIFILYIFLVAEGIISKDLIPFDIIFPTFLVVLVLSILVFIKKSTITEFIHLEEDKISGSKLGQIPYSEIKHHKRQSMRGSSNLILTLKNNRTVNFSPDKQFSDNSSKMFWRFVEELERKLILE